MAQATMYSGAWPTIKEIPMLCALPEKSFEVEEIEVSSSSPSPTPSPPSEAQESAVTDYEETSSSK